MPFRSKSQQSWMFIHKPELANKWAEKYGVPSNLPKRKLKDLAKKRKKD